MASPVAAEREPDTCDQIAKGDRASCKAEARSCDGDAWARRQCERKIAIAHDECLSDRFEKVAARKHEMWEQAGGNDAMAASPKDYFDRDDNSEQRWLERVQTIEAESAAYAALHKQWSACRDTFPAEDAEFMAKLPGNYRTAFAAAVDRVLAKMKEMAPDPSAKKGTPGQPLADGTRKDALQLVRMEAKMPASFRYKEKELAAGLAQSEANAAATEAWQASERAAQVARTGCTPGKPLNAKYTALARKLILSNQYADEAKVVKQAYRQTSGVESGRQGLISNERIFVSVCRMTSAKTCSEIHVVMMREKPPGNPWTSWQAGFTSSDEPFNCNKF